MRALLLLAAFLNLHGAVSQDPWNKTSGTFFAPAMFAILTFFICCHWTLLKTSVAQVHAIEVSAIEPCAG